MSDRKVYYPSESHSQHTMTNPKTMRGHNLWQRKNVVYVFILYTSREAHNKLISITCFPAYFCLLCRHCAITQMPPPSLPGANTLI